MIGPWVAWWIALLALWLVLANQVSPSELAAGALAAAAGATLSVTARRGREVLPRMPLRRVLRLARPAARIPHDVRLLAVALAEAIDGRPPAGELLAVPFDVRSDRDGAGRRVLAAAGGSLAPNTVVVGFDEERGLVVVHRLVPDGDPRHAADPMGLG